MTEDRGILDRRHFLIRSAYFFAGSVLGFNYFSKASACGSTGNRITKPRMALIIDDIGFSRSRLRCFLQIDIPLTFAILPRLPRTESFAQEIQMYNHEIMLHQPMEPCNPDVDPGPGALYLGDEPKKIVDTVEKNISEIPFIAGVNNHMGSRFTSSQEKMDETLRIIKDRNLFFIDSLTTCNSAAYQTAKRLNMAAAFRNIFLDNIPEEQSILRQLDRLKRHAERYGHAIGIGHPFPITALAIEGFVNNLDDPDTSLVPVSQLIRV